MKELVSIIIPVYNREELITKTLESISVQSYSNWECILVDDSSTDNSVAVIQDFILKDTRFQLFSRPDLYPKGANSCRNYGFTKAKGVFVNWFDSDDTMHVDFISRKWDVFDKDRTIQLVLSKTVRLEQNKSLVFETRTNLTDNLLEDYITRKVSWYMPDGMFRKDFLDDKVFFDEHLLGGQDRDFYIKALLFNPKIVVVDFYATNYLVHTASISETLYRKKNKESHIYSFSHFDSLVNQLTILDNRNLLSEKLKKHFFIEIKKKMPSIMFLRKKKKSFYIALYRLSSFKIFYFKQWIKICIATLSFIFFGKGQKFLK